MFLQQIRSAMDIVMKDKEYHDVMASDHLFYNWVRVTFSCGGLLCWSVFGLVWRLVRGVAQVQVGEGLPCVDQMRSFIRL